MSTVNNTIQERGAEWRATSEASMILRLLVESANEASGKKFIRGRQERLNRWQQLASCAAEQASGLAALARAGLGKRGKPLKASVVKESEPIVAPLPATTTT